MLATARPWGGRLRGAFSTCKGPSEGSPTARGGHPCISALHSFQVLPPKYPRTTSSKNTWRPNPHVMVSVQGPSGDNSAPTSHDETSDVHGDTKPAAPEHALSGASATCLHGVKGHRAPRASEETTSEPPPCPTEPAGAQKFPGVPESSAPPQALGGSCPHQAPSPASPSLRTWIAGRVGLREAQSTGSGQGGPHPAACG